MRTTRHDDEFETVPHPLHWPTSDRHPQKVLAPVREQLGAHLEPRALDLVGRHHGAHALPRALAVHPAALVHVAVQRDEAAVAVPLVGRPLALVRVAVSAHLPAVAIARVVCPVALVPGEGMLRASRVCAIRR